MRSLSAIVSSILRVGLCAVFAYAGVEKWQAGREFVEQVANYQFIPEWSPWVALVLPCIEITAALALLLLPRRWRQAGALLMLAMLLMFTLAMARAWSLGINVECGCFGKGSLTIGPLTMLRNFSLIAATVALLWFDREELGRNALA